MIERVNENNLYDVYEFIIRFKDYYQDFYITQNKQRIFLNNLESLRKVLKKQEVYIISNKQIDGLLLVYREKGFRPYIKILADAKNIKNLLKYVLWNFDKEELYLKTKKTSFLSKILMEDIKDKLKIEFHWFFRGDRGLEFLFIKPKHVK